MAGIGEPSFIFFVLVLFLFHYVYSGSIYLHIGHCWIWSMGSRDSFHLWEWEGLYIGEVGVHCIIRRYDGREKRLKNPCRSR